jgi:hypothetical protein
LLKKRIKKMRKKGLRNLNALWKEAAIQISRKGAGAWGSCLDRAGKTFPYGQEYGQELRSTLSLPLPNGRQVSPMVGPQTV